MLRKFLDAIEPERLKYHSNKNRNILGEVLQYHLGKDLEILNEVIGDNRSIGFHMLRQRNPDKYGKLSSFYYQGAPTYQRSSPDGIFTTQPCHWSFCIY